MKKRVLITGSAGFLGSHLAKHHLSCGDVVVGIDNFLSSNERSRHHAELKRNKSYSFVRGDITSKNDLSVFKGLEFDVIYNFACPASPPRYQEVPIETMMTCVAGTNNIISLAGEKTVVVHASTSEVYGDPTESPQLESYRGNVNSYGPRSCYDEGKRAAEALCYDHRNKRGIDVRLVRIFNTYGEQMDIDDGRVVTNFIGRALTGRPLSIYGDGSQTRSFCYVSDLIKGVVALAELDSNPGTPVNVGNPNEFTVLDLARKVQARFNCGLEFFPLPIDDPLQRRPDISLAKKLLDWEPAVEIDEGLDRTIQYFRSLDV